MCLARSRSRRKTPSIRKRTRPSSRARNCLNSADGAEEAVGGQEERDGLHLEPHPPQQAHGEKVEPHHQREAEKGAGKVERGLRPGGEDQLQRAQHLKHRQQHQPQPGRGGLGSTAAVAALGLFLRRHGQQHGLHPAQAQNVSVGHRGAALHRRAVDGDAAGGAQVVDRPGVVLAADQGGVLAGDHRIIQHHVAGAAPAQDVFPVGQGLPRPVGQGQVGPHLRQMGHRQQGTDGADKDQQSQYREHKAYDGRKPAAQLRVGRQPTGQRVHPLLGQGKQRFHPDPLLSLSGAKRPFTA